MSRLFLTSLLFATVSSFASAHPMPIDPDQHFAEPPAVDIALDRRAVRSALAEARDRNLAAFRAYQRKGVFPSNTYRDQKLNVWRDAEGHLCAAATMIDRSGEHDLVQSVAASYNFIRLADVKDGPLLDWILTSGLTQEEVAMIQEPFMPIALPDDDQPDVVAKRRAQENARLRARYTTVTNQLVKDAEHSLDAATDRLIEHKALAARLIRSATAHSATRA
jgi:hypothetical protein